MARVKHRPSKPGNVRHPGMPSPNATTPSRTVVVGPARKHAPRTPVTPARKSAPPPDTTVETIDLTGDSDDETPPEPEPEPEPEPVSKETMADAPALVNIASLAGLGNAQPAARPETQNPSRRRKPDQTAKLHTVTTTSEDDEARLAKAINSMNEPAPDPVPGKRARAKPARYRDQELQRTESGKVWQNIRDDFARGDGGVKAESNDFKPDATKGDLVDWDAVHAVMRARIAEGNPTPDAPRDSPQPGSEDDGAFTEVKSESEEGESDVAPTADEEETKPPPSLTHASESDEFHSAASSTDTKQRIGVKRSGDVRDGGDAEGAKTAKYSMTCGVCGKRFKGVQGQSLHYQRHVIRGATQEERDRGAICLKEYEDAGKEVARLKKFGVKFRVLEKSPSNPPDENDEPPPPIPPTRPSTPPPPPVPTYLSNQLVVRPPTNSPPTNLPPTAVNAGFEYPQGYYPRYQPTPVPMRPVMVQTPRGPVAMIPMQQPQPQQPRAYYAVQTEQVTTIGTALGTLASSVVHGMRWMFHPMQPPQPQAYFLPPQYYAQSPPAVSPPPPEAWQPQPWQH